MTEIWFYHLERQPVEAVLPMLLTRSLDRGWRVVVQSTSPERVAALDEHLWTFAEESFLPHAREDEPDIAEEPIVLATSPANPNAAQARFLIDAAPVPDDADRYERVIVMFDGTDTEALAAARGEWRRQKGSGRALSYWQQDENGRWEKKA